MGEPRLLDRVRAVCARRGLSENTAAAYVFWIRRYIVFHGKRHPRGLRRRHVESFLDQLSRDHLAVRTRNQALSGVQFLYRHVLEGEHGWIEEIPRAKGPKVLPVVLSRGEVQRLLGVLSGVHRLQGGLLYGAGLRLMECASLRVKDVDFERGQVWIRSGKGAKDRTTVLPRALCAPLTAHLERAAVLHRSDVEAGRGWVALPEGYGRKAAGAGREWSWQWVFPAKRTYLHASTGQRRRHHLHESGLQRAVKRALRRAGIPKKASCHSLRHAFATHLIEDGCDVRTLQKLLGHADLSATMVYLHVARNGPAGVTSPLDRLRLPDDPWDRDEDS